MATLYVGGRLFDGENVHDGQAVLEEGGKIKRVAPQGEFAGFAGERVDTSGGTLIPGIIDCHVHSLSGAEGNPGAAQDRLSAAQIAVRGMEYMRSTLEGGITAVRDCGGKDYIEFALRDAFNAGKFLGPTMRCAGRMICMTGGHGNRSSGGNAPGFFKRLGKVGRLEDGQLRKFFNKLGNIGHDVSLLIDGPGGQNGSLGTPRGIR